MASKKLSSVLRKRARNAKRSIDASTIEVAREMREHAIKLTSGSIPKREIDRARPFARNADTSKVIGAVLHGKGKPNPRKRVRVTARGIYPLTPINKHGGKLQRSLRVIRTRTGFRLFFTAPYAKWVLRTGGTKTMVDREFWKQMQRRASNARKKAAAKVRRSLRQP